MTEPPLYERDPEAWYAHLAEGNRTQARKRVGADVLFRDEEGRILLVDPVYKPGWDLPGGMAEANESPLDAAIREVREELGIEWAGGRLLVVDWVPPHGPWDDSLMFIFDGGLLTADQQSSITLRDNELREFRFARYVAGAELLRPRLRARLDAAYGTLLGGQASYLLGGRLSHEDTERPSANDIG